MENAHMDTGRKGRVRQIGRVALASIHCHASNR